MADKSIFIANSGANNAMRRMAVITNDLANANTTGFRADFEKMKSVPLGNNPNSSRTYAVAESTWSDFTPGPMITTGRDLDVALSGKGFIAVQSSQGDEAYTRAGALQVRNGVLATQHGEPVRGTNGIINIPQNANKIVVGADGTVSVQLMGEKDMVTQGQIKLVNPAISQLQKGQDGLFHVASGGGSVQQDDSVRLLSGALEGSNVNPVDTLTKLIDLSRRFDMQTNFMKSVESNDEQANKLLDVQG